VTALQACLGAAEDDRGSARRRKVGKFAGRAKLLRVSYDSPGMRMSTPATQSWVGRTALVMMHAATWWTALTAAGMVLTVLVYRLLAERGRRKTLEAMFQAPAGTVVALGKSPVGPSMLVLVGEGQRFEQPVSAIWVCHRSGMQVRSRRQA
jgi:hypothetical protein